MARKRVGFIMGILTIPALLLLLMGGQALLAAVRPGPAIVHTKIGLACPSTGKNETQSIGLHSDHYSPTLVPWARTPKAAIADVIAPVLPNTAAGAFRLSKEFAAGAEYVLLSPSNDVIARVRLARESGGGWALTDLAACAFLSRGV